MKNDPLDEIFARHGISDPRTFLEENGSNEEVMTSVSAEVLTRGSVFLMLGRVISRKEVERRASKLKYG
jgi:hypothetical protein